MKRVDRIALVFGAICGLLLLFNSPSVLAREPCSCDPGQQCSFETCCYTDGTCMDTGGGTSYNRCVIEWHEPSHGWTCSTGAQCTGEECDGGGNYD